MLVFFAPEEPITTVKKVLFLSFHLAQVWALASQEVISFRVHPSPSGITLLISVIAHFAESTMLKWNTKL